MKNNPQRTIELSYTPDMICDYAHKMAETNKGKENEHILKDVETLVKLAATLLHPKERENGDK